jgi:peptidoglycan-associated lipoprotein
VATNTTTTSTASLETIYFNFNQRNITAEAKEILKRNISYLEKNPDATLTISAFCDSRGSADYNLLLSKKSAESTVSYLKKLGLAPERIKDIVWFGEKDPLNKCVDGTPCSISEYKINRRVEFKVNKTIK